MIIQEVEVSYCNKYGRECILILYVDIPVSAEKVDKYCRELLHDYVGFTNFKPVDLWDIDLWDIDLYINFAQLINSKALLGLKKFDPFIKEDSYVDTGD